MSEQDFDVVVIGGGPAGLEAAAVVAAAGLRCVVIDRMGPGGQLMNLGALQGMAGLAPDATGPDLLAEIADRAMTAGAEIAVDDVGALTRNGGRFHLEALDGRYTATAVILATGLTPGTTGLADEARYEGAGLSHCAHCDAPLHAGQPVAVAGGDAWAIEEAIELAGYASRVTLVIGCRMTASADRLATLTSLANVTAIEGRIIGLDGASALDAIVIDGPAGRTVVPARGLFLQTGRVPALGLLGAVAEEAPGLFLAGDVRRDSRYTIADAMASGSEAGHTAVAFVAGSAKD